MTLDLGQKTEDYDFLVWKRTWPSTRKRDDFPHPLGPHTRTFLPDTTSKVISLTRTSPFGVTRGTRSKLITWSFSMMSLFCVMSTRATSDVPSSGFTSVKRKNIFLQDSPTTSLSLHFVIIILEVEGFDMCCLPELGMSR